MMYIDWLKNYRIELDTVLAAAGLKAFWNWLKWKLKQAWPHRNYNRAMFFNSYLYTPIVNKEWQWNGARPSVKPLLPEFYIYLAFKNQGNS
jgi:hypothetical protein